MLWGVFRSGLALSIFSMLFSFSAYGVSSAPMSSGADGIYFSLGAKALMGEVGAENEASLASRDMLVFGAETVLGYQVSDFIIGAGAEYNMWSQRTKVEEVSNTNLAGNQMKFSGVLGYRWAPVVLIGKYYFASTYDLKKADASGYKSKYSEPASAFAVQLLYNWDGGSHIGLEYTAAQYEKINIAGIDADLADDDKLNATAWGVVYVWIY